MARQTELREQGAAERLAASFRDERAAFVRLDVLGPLLVAVIVLAAIGGVISAL
jgi:hypothetical protein